LFKKVLCVVLVSHWELSARVCPPGYSLCLSGKCTFRLINNSLKCQVEENQNRPKKCELQTFEIPTWKPGMEFSVESSLRYCKNLKYSIVWKQKANLLIGAIVPADRERGEREREREITMMFNYCEGNTCSPAPTLTLELTMIEVLS
jgi:hypothetical protein